MNMSLINNQKGVTVKDVPAKEFIQEYAKFLKKGNKIRIPEVSLTHSTCEAKQLVQFVWCVCPSLISKYFSIFLIIFLIVGCIL